MKGVRGLIPAVGLHPVPGAEEAGCGQDVVAVLDPPEEVSVYGFFDRVQFVASEAVPPLIIRYRNHYQVTPRNPGLGS